MHFEMKIDMDDAAFDDFPEFELYRILQVVEKKLIDGSTFGSVFDANGNKAGEWMIVTDD